MIMKICDDCGEREANYKCPKCKNVYCYICENERCLNFECAPKLIRIIKDK